MRKNTLKCAALVAATGTVLGWGGCLNWQQLLRTTATYAALEAVTDGPWVTDVFEDDAEAVFTAVADEE